MFAIIHQSINQSKGGKGVSQRRSHASLILMGCGCVSWDSGPLLWLRPSWPRPSSPAPADAGPASVWCSPPAPAPAGDTSEGVKDQGDTHSSSSVGHLTREFIHFPFHDFYVTFFIVFNVFILSEFNYITIYWQQEASSIILTGFKWAGLCFKGVMSHIAVAQSGFSIIWTRSCFPRFLISQAPLFCLLVVDPVWSYISQDSLQASDESKQNQQRS